jgi:hypothetical protein
MTSCPAEIGAPGVGFTADELCRILASCASSRVAELSVGSLRVTFQHAILETPELAASLPREQSSSTSVRPTESIDFEKLHDLALQNDDLDAKEQALEELAILDPSLYEKLLSTGDLVKREEPQGDETEFME